ncbi:STE3-domain-containing protein [Peniophora sp. CONT]|nr:STE3-domain-containing protein [Peniophora sp. CONT]
MAASVDPTYPLYPIACILSSAMLLLVLLTSFIRQSWNLGVAFLCFWMFFENLTAGINAIIWADNTDIKLYIYCDVVSHVQLIAFVVKPMATLIITRKLYLITSLQSVEAPNKAAKYRELAIEWTLGLVIPVVVAGPFYYIVQYSRFEVDEGFGCNNSPDGSVLSVLLLNSWSVFPPLISIIVYYPRVARTCYRQSRDTNYFRHSNDSVSRTNYFRILALASVDIILTLPIGIANIVLVVVQSGPFPFYLGWDVDHTEWEPQGLSYAEIVAQGTSTLAQVYFAQWTSPFLAFVIFGLFGVTSEARVSYWRIICTIGGWLGWKPTLRRARTPLGDMKFGQRPPQDMSLGLESQPSYVNHGMRAQEQDAERGHGHAATSEVESGLDNETVEETRRASSDIAHAEHLSRRYSSYNAEGVDASGSM